MQNIQVSVIIPAYNCAKYITQALDSALEQEEVNLEVIIINDCSPDQIDTVLEPYLEDDRIRYVHNEKNLGVAQTRNKGVSLAKGEYVAFLDADDWWSRDKLKRQISLLNETGDVLCATARELFDEQGNSMGKVIPVKETIAYQRILYHNMINCSSVVLKREIALEFPMECEGIHEDYLTWIRILKKYKKACAINEPMLKYRFSAGSKSGNKLKSAKMTYFVYKEAGFHSLAACYYFVFYALHGLMKYRGIPLK